MHHFAYDAVLHCWSAGYEVAFEGGHGEQDAGVEDGEPGCGGEDGDEGALGL